MFAQIFIHTSALVFVSLKPKDPTGLSPAESESCYENMQIEPLNAKLNPICHMLALLRAHPILHISRIRVEP